MSTTLFKYLKFKELDEYNYEIASLWARYNCEDFGCRDFLRHLLENEKINQAEEYSKTCFKYIETSKLWSKSTELKEFGDWLKIQEEKFLEQNKRNHKPNIKKKKKRSKV